MNKRTLLAVVIAAAVVVAGVVMLLPAVLTFLETDSTAPPAPEYGSVVAVSDARLVLPPVAGGPAAVYFDITNRGDRSTILTEVAVEHGTAELHQTTGPATTRVASVDIDPGQTISHLRLTWGVVRQVGCVRLTSLALQHSFRIQGLSPIA